MGALQNSAWETNVYLSLVDVPATGILFNQITVKYKKAGQSSMTTRTLSAPDWVELGAGFYIIKWPASFTNVLGSFFYTLTGAGFDNFLSDEFLIEPVPPVLLGPAETCLVTGNIVDVMGRAGTNFISVRALTTPIATDDGRILSAEFKKTLPDADGNFSIRLLRNQTFLFEVEGTGIRFQIAVPDAPSANIIDLLPPLS